LDENEMEFIDLLEELPGDEQRVLAKEVYEKGFSLELLEKIRNWQKKVEKPFLKVAYPRQTGQRIRGNPIFVFGSTTPAQEVKVTVNEVEVEKFDHRTGNFLTLVEVPTGREFPIKVTATKKGEETSVERNVIYEPVWQEMPVHPLAIHATNVVPKQDQVLGEGDWLRVIVQGSPEAEAVFRIGHNSQEITMVELDALPSPLEGKGVYMGSYLVKKEDVPLLGESAPQTITVTLRRANNQVSRELPGRVIFTSGIPPRIVEVIGSRTRMYQVREVRADSFNLLGFTLGGDGALTQVMCFDLLPKTRFAISGSAGEYLRVKLGEENYLIHQKEVQEVKGEIKKPFTALSKISLKETETETEIRLNSQEQIPFLIEDESQGLRLILYGAQKSENIIFEGQSSSVKTIEVSTLSPEDSSEAVLINIELYHFLAGFNYYWDGTKLVISIRKLPDISEYNPLQGKVIVLDPGHGGESIGAIGPGDIHEKEVVLEIAKFLQGLLIEKGAQVIMTRSQDINVNVQKRIDMAVENKADLFISIHANSHAEGADAINYHGPMTLYNYHYNEKLAEIMLASLVKRTGLPPTRVWQRADLTVLRCPQLPSVLVETGFLMHPDDNWYLLQPEYQYEIAKAIADGIVDYFLYLKSSKAVYLLDY
ncbi:MAG: N-acetylmuramoyl-L-alanine amidase, partial [Candidatus Caldatribacteriota bacterium]